MEKNKLAVSVVGDFLYLYKYFARFKKSLLERGKYSGEILILTSILSPTFLLRSIRNDKKVKVIRFKRIKFSKKTDYSLRNLNTLGQPNRHIKKRFQWHKINLFDKKMKKWKYIFYIDINMYFHDDINSILEIHPVNNLFARADGYPDYKRKLSSQFDSTKDKFSILKEKFDLEINDYFQTGILYFDTEIIEEETKNEIISIVDRFPISLTNEQGIMNLYFIFIKNQYKELTKEIGDAITYYYWLIPGKKIIITKQLKEKYK